MIRFFMKLGVTQVLNGLWGFPQCMHDNICCLLLCGLAPVNLNTSPEDAAEVSPPPWTVIAFCAANSIHNAILIAVFKVRTGSKSRRHWMCESFTPHTTRLSTNISRDFPKLQNLARALTSDMNVKMDSPCYLNQLKKLCSCMISDGLRLWLFFIAFTKLVYDLSFNLSGATKLWSIHVYVASMPLVRQQWRESLSFYLPHRCC